MKTTLLTLVLLSFLTPVAYAQAPGPILIDFENLAVMTKRCPSGTADKGVSFAGVHVIDGWFTGLNETRLLSATEAGPTSFTCATNPIEIRFPEPVGQVEFDLITSNDVFTISDNTGWSRTFSVRAEANGTTHPNPGFYRTRVVVPSTQVSRITLTNHCSLYNKTGCREQWRIVVDNVTFSKEVYCLAVLGPESVEPNERKSPTKDGMQFIVEVTDCQGTYVDEVEVETTVTVDPTSGGHSNNHATSTRPKGSLRDDVSGASGAGSNPIVRTSAAGGLIPLQFVPPEVSGVHTISAKCTKVACIELEPPLKVKVKVEDLLPIPSHEYYTLTEYLPGTEIGKNIGDNGKHNNQNHFLTTQANSNLGWLALHYALLSGSFQKLHVNDASLPWGGLFDIEGTWTTSHRGHRKGTVVDIRANQKPGAVPPESDTAFRLAAGRVGAEAVREFIGLNPPSLPDSREHYHTMLTGVDQ